MTEPSADTGLVVNLVVDFVCPWCFIGSTRLDQAIAEVAKDTTLPEVRVVHQPFMLDPTAPAEGRDLRAHLASKYGGDPQAMFARVEGVAKETGIALDFSKITRIPSTVNAHTLAQQALEKGTQRAFIKDLYEAYFMRGEDIGSEPVLLAIATRHGFTEDEARGYLADEKERSETHAEARAASDQGISGVPFFVFDGRFAVSGAQGVPVLVEALRRSTTGTARP